jgi:hypothetical protein
MTRHRSLQCKVLLSMVTMLGLQASAISSGAAEIRLPNESQTQSTDQSVAISPQDKAANIQSTTEAPPAVAVSQQSAPAAKPQQSPTPVGTAAAPDTHVDGVAASTPSGAAIAPGKQRRVRRFTVRTALIVGAVVAVGIVSAVTLASPSRP